MFRSNISTKKPKPHQNLLASKGPIDASYKWSSKPSHLPMDSLLRQTLPVIISLVSKHIIGINVFRAGRTSFWHKSHCDGKDQLKSLKRSCVTPSPLHNNSKSEGIMHPTAIKRIKATIKYLKP